MAVQESQDKQKGMVPAFHELNIAVVRKCTVCIDLKFRTIGRATPVIAYCGSFGSFKYYTDFLTAMCEHHISHYPFSS